MGERVSDRGHGRPAGYLACAEGRRFLIVDEIDLDRRDFVEPEYRISGPAARGDPVALELDLFFQGPACGHDHAALDLVARSVRVDDEAAIGRTPHLCQANLFLRLERHRHGDVSAAIAMAVIAKT